MLLASPDKGGRGTMRVERGTFKVERLKDNGQRLKFKVEG